MVDYNKFEKDELIEFIKSLEQEIDFLFKTNNNTANLGKSIGKNADFLSKNLEELQTRVYFSFEENKNLLVENAKLKERLEYLSEMVKLKSKKRNKRLEKIGYSLREYKKAINLLRKNVFKLEDKLNSKIFGQEESNAKLVRLLKAHFSGLKEEKPAVYFLHGPTGCGKTYTAEILSEQLFEGFGNKKPGLLRISGSDYMEKHEVAKLYGAPPGYLGHDDGSILTNHMMVNPFFSVMLIDEVEKAHPKFHKYFLPLFDNGITQDSENNDLDGRKYVILMTSNIGESFIQDKHAVGFNPGNIFEQERKMKAESLENFFRKSFPPEFRNRIGEVIHLNHLSDKSVQNILEFEFDKIRSRAYDEYNADLILEPEAKHELIKRGFSIEYGARNLKRVLEKEIMANDELINMISKSYSCRIGYSNDNFTFEPKLSITHGKYFKK